MELTQKGQTIDSESFLYYHDLQNLLIASLDKIIKRNSIDTSTLNSFKIQSELGEDSTSYKIAAAFIEGLKINI